MTGTLTSPELAIACPRCGEKAVVQANRITCPACGEIGRVDEFGVIRLTDKAFYYREVAQEDLQWVLEGDDATDLLLRLDEITRKRGERLNTYIKGYALDANRAAGVFLLDLNDQSVVLDYGSGWGNITRVLADACAHVYSLDLTYESLQFSARIGQTDNGTYIHAGDGPHLPFASGSLDAVILNGVLEWVPEGTGLDQHPRTVQLQFLQEVHRVLREGGQIFVAIENRFGIRYFMGVKEDHTGLRYGALLPRPVSNLYSQQVRKRPYRTYTYSYRGYRELLGDAGFQIEIYHPWPNYRWFTTIYTPATVNEYRLPSTDHRSAKRKLADGVLGAVTGASKFQWLTPAFMIVGAKVPGRESQSVLSRAVEQQGDDLDAIRSITLSSTKTILMRTDARFYKVGLTAISRRRLEEAHEAQQTLRIHFPDLAQFAATAGELHYVGKVAYMVEPLYSPVDPDDERLDAFFRDYLGQVAQQANDGPLDIRQRLTHVLAYAQEATPSGADIEQIVDYLDGLTWSLAPTHGDLHRSNVVTDEAGQLRLIDWDQFELSGPFQIDVAHLAVRDRMRSYQIGWPAAMGELWHTLLKPSSFPSACDDVEVTVDAFTLYMLDRLEKDISSVPHYAYLPFTWRAQADAVLNLLTGRNAG